MIKQIENRKATYNYNFLEKFEAGVALSGTEAKSIRAGRASLADSYVIIRGGEAYLVNAYIAPYEKSQAATDPRKARKLLLHKTQINYLQGKLAGSNLTLVPTRLYFRHNFAKIEIALAQSKKKYDKREALRRKALEREAERAVREDKAKYQDQE